MKSEKNILILCDPIAPPAYAPRVMNLCKNTIQYGWHPHIISEGISGTEFSTTICPIYTPIYFRNHGWAGKIEWFMKSVMDICFNAKAKWFTREIKKEIKNKKFDIIFCSSFNLFPLPSALAIAKQLDIPLVVDLRDIAEQWGSYTYLNHSLKGFTCLAGKIYESNNIKRRDKVLKYADAVTTISTWHYDLLKRKNTNTHLIYNGFDANIFKFEQVKSKYFNITYTGKLYDIQFRNPTLMFEALQELIAEKRIESDLLQINWYIDSESHSIINSLGIQFELQECMNINGYVASDKIPDLLQQASIVLLLTNKTENNGPHGIMTTKFFEALGVEKPILCVRSDEECLADTIKETNAGLAATNTEEVKRFILDKYNEWKTNGFTRQHIDPEVKRKFSRQYQAEQFISLFDSLIKE